MLRYVTVIAFAILTISNLNTVSGNEVEKLQVNVYYESLCPHSIAFIVNQLVPSYENFKEFLNVTFIPYGKASYKIENNHITFQCQHGPRECHGNKAQACALYQIDDVFQEDNLRQQRSVDIIGCTMASRDPSTAVPECAKKFGFPEYALTSLDHCSNTADNFGDYLLMQNGQKTDAFESPIAYVPSVTINGVKNKEAERNFADVMCRMLSEYIACVES